jgi:hypothetical protein
MKSPRRARWAVLITCGALLGTATPASAQTQQADAVALARTLADGFTAIDARAREARAATGAWLAEQGRCAKPRIRSRFRRQMFTAVRRQSLHSVALRALAPELEQLTGRLRALPVSDAAIRGGVHEVLLDYGNVRALMTAEPPSLCKVVRALRSGDPVAYAPGPFEDERASERALGRRQIRLRAAQRALLKVEVDPRLARSLDSVFEHATAGLYRSRLEVRERLAPPFAIVTDDATLARLRTEAASVAAATGTLVAAQRDIARRLEGALARTSRCGAAFNEAVERRPKLAAGLFGVWLVGEIAAAADRPVERFLADVSALNITDPALSALLARTTVQVEWMPDMPRTNLCSELRAWRRADWDPAALDLADGIDALGVLGVGGAVNGIRLEDEQIDRAVLRRRGVPRAAVRALVSPLDMLLAGLTDDQASNTQAVASSVSAASAALMSRGVWRSAQATSAALIGRAGAR